MNTERRVSRRLVVFVAVLTVWGALANNLILKQAQAQDKPAAEAPAGDAAAAPAAEGEKPAEQAAPASQNYLWYVIQASGIFGFVIFLMSIYMVAQVARMFFEIRVTKEVPQPVIAQVEELITKRDFKTLFTVVKEDPSFFSRCLSTGITELPNGLAEARDVVQRMGDAITVEMDKKISMLAVLGTVGPLVGLLGTLQGMIGAFDVIGMQDTQIKASEVARNISTAMWTTLEGVVLAVPAIYFFAFFRNRVSVISSTALIEADRFLRHFAHAARTKAAPAATGTTATVAKPIAKAE